MIFVVNKSDLVSIESLKEQIEPLKKIAPVVFISTKKKGSIKLLLYIIKKVFKKYGKRPGTIKEKSNAHKLKFRETKADIVVGVLGYPNVGKSSVINSLCHKKKLKVSKKPGTTHGIHWIRATKEIKLIDSPGVIPLKKDDEIRYGLIGAKDGERLKYPEVVSSAIINLFLQNKKKEKFENFYRIKIEYESKEDFYGILDKIAQKRRFLLKGGNFDLNRASLLIIKDWQEGKLRM
jgi:ribosome biogenesis GTPase A